MQDKDQSNLKNQIDRLHAEKAGIEALKLYLKQMNKSDNDMFGLSSTVFNKMNYYQVNDMLSEAFKQEVGDDESTRRYKETGRTLMNQYLTFAETNSIEGINQLVTQEFML